MKCLKRKQITKGLRCRKGNLEGIELYLLIWHRKERKNIPRNIPMLGGEECDGGLR